MCCCCHILSYAIDDGLLTSYLQWHQHPLKCQSQKWGDSHYVTILVPNTSSKTPWPLPPTYLSLSKKSPKKTTKVGGNTQNCATNPNNTESSSGQKPSARLFTPYIGKLCPNNVDWKHVDMRRAVQRRRKTHCARESN